jgi:predicted GNAT family acetyltransferase
MNGIIELPKSLIKPADRMLARAFQDYPPYVYYIDDAEKRRRHLPVVLNVSVQLGFHYGKVYATSTNLEGVLITMPHPGGEYTFWRLVRCGVLGSMLGSMFRLGFSVGEKMGQIEGTIAQAHEDLLADPHIYVMQVGVDPAEQGKGYATKLFNHVFAIADEGHLPVFIDTCSETDVAIYQHLDFETVDTRPIGQTGLVTTALVRAAR